MRDTSPFTTKIIHDEIHLEQAFPITFTHKKYQKLYTYFRSGLRVAKTYFKKEKRLQGSEEEIIEQIHAIRYAESNPYVITGGHFSQLFVRNLGIFFNALLDHRIPSTQQDWEMRQAVALKTVAIDLELFAQAGKEYTTLLPIRRNLYTGVNFYVRPSDSLHAILYTLAALKDERFIPTRFPSKASSIHRLQTKSAAKKLLKTYKKTLVDLIAVYKSDLLDQSTGLIKKDLLLASARDGIKRQSAFYDNVILWSTIQQSAELGLLVITDKRLQEWKERIIEAFWCEDEGIFLDDLSQLSQQQKLFSADSFVVISTGFLTSKKVKEQKMLLRMVAYVKKYKLDQPLPLHYAILDFPNQLYRPVRHFAPEYMGTSIWSHWGMEYIKVLIALSKYEPRLLPDAKKHLSAYKKNIEQYGGYPEVYDAGGKLLQTRLYRSVLHNGWVINYEQTKMLLHNS